jgi:F-type H+-transporting ATPase subunit delta
MRADPIARAYAQALYQIAKAEEAVERVEDELFQVRKMIESQGRLREFLRDVSLPPEVKKQALIEILGEKVSSLALNHLEFVIDQGRGDLISQIATAFSDMVFAAKNQVVAEVTTAIPLDPQLSEKLQKKLSEVTGRNVAIKNLVDKSILGGVVVRLKDKIINGSLRQSLDELREALMTAELKE